MELWRTHTELCFTNGMLGTSKENLEVEENKDPTVFLWWPIVIITMMSLQQWNNTYPSRQLQEQNTGHIISMNMNRKIKMYLQPLIVHMDYAITTVEFSILILCCLCLIYVAC